MNAKKIIAIMLVTSAFNTGCTITEKQVRAEIAARQQQENMYMRGVYNAEMERLKQIERMSHTADFGPIPKNWKDLARVAILSRLKNPYTPEIVFNKQPYKSFIPHYMVKQAVEASGYNPTTGKFDYNKNIYTTAFKAKTFDTLPKPDTTIKPGDVEYVWKVDVYVNATNSFGGYTGLQQYTVAMKNGEIIQVGPSGISDIDFEQMRLGIAGTENMLRMQRQ